MNQEADYLAGMELARQAMHALADGEDDRVLAVLNGGKPAEVAWCAACLLSALREAVGVAVKHDPGEVRRLLHTLAEPSEEDVAVTRISLMLQAEFGGDLRG